MLEFSVFYSWQLDRARSKCKDVIGQAASEAIDRLRLDASIEDSPRLDHDTKDIAGAPDIATTIFNKIDRCGIFLADVTFVGETNPIEPEKRPKKLPNPNVMLELGYAAARVGWDRIILVMNTEFGEPD